MPLIEHRYVKPQMSGLIPRKVDKEAIVKYRGQKFGMSVFWDPYVNYRLSTERNVVALTVGEPGTQKSIRTLGDMYYRDPDFTLENVKFTTLDFLTLVRNQKQGFSNMYDDVGVGASAQEWYDEQSKVLGKVIESYRDMGGRNVGTLTYLTTPRIGFLEPKSRSLINVLFQASKKRRGVFEPKLAFELTNRPNKPEMHYPYPRVWVDGKKRVITEVLFPLPPQKIIDEYRKMKHEHMQQFYDIYLEKLKRALAKQKRGDGHATGGSKKNPNSLANLRNQGKYFQDNGFDVDIE